MEQTPPPSPAEVGMPAGYTSIPPTPTTPPPFGAISPTGIVPSHIPIPSTPPTPSPVMYVSTNDPVHPPPAVQRQEDKRRNREPIHLTPLMEQVAQRLIDTKLVTTRIL